MTPPRILVVDDDGPILLLMRSLLREFGFEPVLASSGEEAIAAARAQTPALILLDRNMPGMPGDRVVKALREDSALTTVPILILSGEPIDAQELQIIGADGAVQKPFDILSLLDQIRSYTGNQVSSS
jgi:DNA-binding response OmpR family regulator